MKLSCIVVPETDRFGKCTIRSDIAGRENPAPTATPYPALLAPFRIVHRPPAAYTPPPSSRQGRGPP
eukprot:3050887-Heterocapsa_arctica.AAC.1